MRTDPFDITVPPTEAQVAEVLNWMQDHSKAATDVIRRLAYQRDLLVLRYSKLHAAADASAHALLRELQT